MTRRIAIIGAGASGMTATKACLEQGFDVVVFEKTSYTGGLWRYKENMDLNGIASVMKSTIINSSKEMSAFSDFPPPPEYPNYMHNTKMVNYFDMYAEKFNFIKHVRFQHEIISVEMADDYDTTGRWRIHARNLENLKEVTEVFDGVMVCTGHHGTVNQPKFPGQRNFKGTIMHTHSLKTAKGFEDKNVVVVGIGNSGGDAAVELSVVAKQVYLSTRTGSWIFHRVGTNGRPFDQFMHRRFLVFLWNLFPYWLTCWVVERYLDSVFNHEDYQLRPKHHCFSQHIMVNDALPNRILSGTITIKGDIDHFEEYGVVFKGKTEVTPCDAVILATGYKVEFPFISEEIVPVHQNKVRLYKWQFVPNLKHPHTLAFISLAQPIGALLPIGELQSRWFALLMANKLRLPSREEMEKDIEHKQSFQNRFYESERHTIQVDWVPFMDELAKEIGAFPPLWKYLFTDPKLFFNLVFGACVPYQYRLEGPNAWEGAREACLSTQDRIDAALQTKHSGKLTDKDQRKTIPFSLKRLNFIHFFVIFSLFSIVFVSAISTLLVSSFL